MAEWDLERTLPDIPRIYTALAEWLSCLFCILEMKPRLGRGRFFGISALALLVQSVFLALTKGHDGLLWCLFMAAAVFFMFLFIYACCDTGVLDAVYNCIRAFVMAEFMASLQWQLHCYCYYACGFTGRWLAAVLLAGVYGLAYLFLWYVSRRVARQGYELDITWHETIFSGIVGLSVFAISNLGFISSNTPFGGRYAADIFNVRTLVDLSGLAIFYAYHMQRLHLRAQQELDRMEMILHNQYAQYQQSQETLDLINYKYHDLKHHILALRAEEDARRRGEYLDQMEEDIKKYAVQQHTGNSVLDTLLTSKGINCMKHDISLTVVADGALLDFMDVMDICSIFGNALDNAVECEKKIADKEKRMIHLSVFSQKAFLIIRLENYCEEELRFEKQAGRSGHTADTGHASDSKFGSKFGSKFDRMLPVTTKEHGGFHGYGLKSLQHTVHKYHGEMDISLKDRWFGLKILIPL